MLVPAHDGWSTGSAVRSAPQLPPLHFLAPQLLHPGARGPAGTRLSISADEEWAVRAGQVRDPGPTQASARQCGAPHQVLPVPERVLPRPGRYAVLPSSVGAARVASPLVMWLGPV